MHTHRNRQQAPEARTAHHAMPTHFFCWCLPDHAGGYLPRAHSASSRVPLQASSFHDAHTQRTLPDRHQNLPVNFQPPPRALAAQLECAHSTDSTHCFHANPWTGRNWVAGELRRLWWGVGLEGKGGVAQLECAHSTHSTYRVHANTWTWRNRLAGELYCLGCGEGMGRMRSALTARAVVRVSHCWK